MTAWIDALIVLLVLTNLMVLGASRLAACIRAVAVQGVLLGCLPLLAHFASLRLHLVLPAIASIGLKGVLFPALLLRSMRTANVRREVDPYVGFGTSIVAGMGMLAVSLWIGRGLPVPELAGGSLLAPAALFTILVGLFIIVSRRKALTQVLGYLAMENGIYAFGLGFAQNQPMLIELGILLDVFMAVFVMGITIFHINQEFDHIDTDRLAQLKD